MGPANQRPEIWDLYNGRIGKGEHVRVFPISNWTELNVWRYIALEDLPLPSIYFSHEREVFPRDGMLYATSPFVELMDDEEPSPHRSATARSATCRARGLSSRNRRSLEAVVSEIAATRVTERGETRADDRVTEAAMEDRKREGYF